VVKPMLDKFVKGIRDDPNTYAPFCLCAVEIMLT